MPDGTDFPKESVADFAKRIRAKHPGAYDDNDDADLVERYLVKNPIYADRVDLPDGFSVRRSTTGYKKLDDLYEQAGRKHNVNVDLLIEQGRKETAFKPDVMYGRTASRNAQGKVIGARGSGQFMPDTAKRFNVDVTNPASGIDGQARYMRELLDMFDGREDLALAGYNAGEHRQALKAGRVPKIKETQDYVKVISDRLSKVRTYGQLRQLLGQTEVRPHSTMQPTDTPLSTSGKPFMRPEDVGKPTPTFPSQMPSSLGPQTGVTNAEQTQTEAPAQAPPKPVLERPKTQDEINQEFEQFVIENRLERNQAAVDRFNAIKKAEYDKKQAEIDAYNRWVDEENKGVAALNKANEIGNKINDLETIGESIKTATSADDALKRQAEIQARFDKERAANPALTAEQFNATLKAEAEAKFLAENATYADFLKQTGLPNNDDSIREFNLAQKASVEGANAQNRADAGKVASAARPGSHVQQQTQQKREVEPGKGVKRIPVKIADMEASGDPNAFIDQRVKQQLAADTGADISLVDEFIKARGGRILRDEPYTPEEIAGLKEAGYESITANLETSLSDEFRRFAKDAMQEREAEQQLRDEAQKREFSLFNPDDISLGLQKFLEDPIGAFGSDGMEITAEEHRQAKDEAVDEQIRNAGSARQARSYQQQYDQMSTSEQIAAHLKNDIWGTINKSPAAFARTAAWWEDAIGYLRENNIILPTFTTTDIMNAADWIGGKVLGYESKAQPQGSLPTLIASEIEAMYSDDKRTANTVAGKMSRAVGSAVPFMLGAMASGGSTAAIALMGVGMSAGDLHKQAKDAGLSREKQLLAGGAGAALGASEIAGLKWARLGKLINDRTKGVFLKSFAEWARQTGKEFTEEGLQEFFQSASGKIVIEGLKKDRVTLDDVAKAIGGSVEDAAMGGIVGMLFGGGVPIVTKGVAALEGPTTKADTSALLKQDKFGESQPLNETQTSVSERPASVEQGEVVRDQSVKGEDAVEVEGDTAKEFQADPLVGLKREARKYKNFEDFSKSYSVDVNHGLFYHLTDNPNFTPRDDIGSRDMSSLAGEGTELGSYMVTSDLNLWDEHYNTNPDTDEPYEVPKRGYVAIIDLSQSKTPRPTVRGFGHEVYLNAEQAKASKVIKVVPIAEAKKFDAEYTSLIPQSKEELRQLWEKEHAAPKPIDQVDRAKLISEQTAELSTPTAPDAETKADHLPDAGNVMLMDEKGTRFKLIETREDGRLVVENSKGKRSVKPAAKLTPVRERRSKMVIEPPKQDKSNAVEQAPTAAQEDAKVETRTIEKADTREPWEMSPEEIEAEYQAAKNRDESLLVELFGTDGAKRYKQLQAKANSSYAPFDQIDAAAKKIQAMEGKLTPEQQNRLFGIGETGPQVDDLKDYRFALEGVTGDTEAELGRSLKYAITRINEKTDPATMNHEERVAYAQIRRAFELASEKGLNTQKISEEAVRSAAERWSDPDDLKVMLGQFIKQTQARETAKEIPAQVKGELAAHVPALPESQQVSPTAEPRKSKRLTRAQKTEADRAAVIEKLRKGDGGFISAQLRGPHGSLINTSDVIKEAGLEPIPGRLNHYRKAEKQSEPTARKQERQREEDERMARQNEDAEYTSNLSKKVAAAKFKKGPVQGTTADGKPIDYGRGDKYGSFSIGKKSLPSGGKDTIIIHDPTNRSVTTIRGGGPNSRMVAKRIVVALEDSAHDWTVSDIKTLEAYAKSAVDIITAVMDSRMPIGMRNEGDTPLHSVARQNENFDQPSNYTFKESDYRPKVVNWAKNQWGDKIAPNGKPVYQNFVRWFDDSKAVDENGEPLQVHHGGASGITEFDMGRSGEILYSDWGPGIHFTPVKWMAEEYRRGYAKVKDAETNRLYDAMAEKAKEYGTDPMSAWLDLKYNGKNPDAYEEIKALETAWRDRLKAVDAGGEGATYSVYLKIENPLIYTYGGITEPDLTLDAQSRGHDGVIIQNESGYWEELIVFRPNQIKSATDNNGNFSTEDDSILRSVAKSEAFYSQLERTIESKMPVKASADQVRGIIRDTKQEERDWLGIDEFLGSKDSFTRDEVLEFVRANNVEVEEVVKGGSPRWEGDDLLDADGDRVANLIENDDGTWTYYSDFSDGSDSFDSRAAAQREAEATTVEDPFGNTTGTKFSQYTLPGGENYKELLLTLPDRSRMEDAYAVESFNGQRSHGIYPTERQAEEAAGRLREGGYPNAEVRHIPNSQPVGRENNFTSSHFNEPNILAHVRFDERDSGKTLHIAEIQSDWHQAGRKKGYAISENADVPLKAVSIEDGDQRGRGFAVSTEGGRFITNVIRPEGGLTEDAAIAEARRRMSENPEQTARHDSRVPDAPFKRSWQEFAFKRMLRYAAENGYERITWDTGETQADRYDLSKQVDAIGVDRSGDTHFVNITVKGGDVIRLDVQDGKVTKDRSTETSEFKNKELADVIGKDLAEKVLETKEGEFTKLEGSDLKVGGEGMKGFYDKILPAFVNKYTKKWGGKVESGYVPVSSGRAEEIAKDETLWAESIDPNGEMPFDETTYAERLRVAEQVLADNADDSAPVHSLKITPAMRESVLQGQPLFKKRTPESYNLLTKELPEAHTQDVLEGITSALSGSDLELNEYGSEVVRRLMGSRAALRHESFNDAEFDGITLNAGQVADLARIGRDWSSRYKKLGYTAQQLAPFNQLLADMDALADINKDFAVMYLYDDALAEEKFHQEDLRTGRTDAKAIAILKESPLWQDPGKVFNDEYPNLSDKDKASELIAKLYTGQEARYGWNKLPDFEAIRNAFYAAWIDGVIRQNADRINTESLEAFFESFKRVGNLYGQVQTNRTETGRANKSIPEGEGGVRQSSGSSGSSQRDNAEAGKSEKANKDGDRTATRKEREVGQRKAAFSRILGQDYYYDPQSHEQTEQKAAQLVGKVGTEQAVWEALNGKPRAETMRVVYWELERLNGLAEAYLQSGEVEKFNAVATEIAELSAGIILRQVATGQEVDIAKTLKPMSPEVTILTATKIVKYRRGDDAQLTADQTKTAIKLANELKQANADLARANEENAKNLRKIKRLESETEPRKRSTSQDRLLKEYKKKETDILAKLREAFPNSPMFSGESEALRMVAWHGSPHVFDKFSTDKIGTGEGAQAYGYGLYFASSEDVADYYKNALGRIDPDSIVIKVGGTDYSSPRNKTAQTVIRDLREDFHSLASFGGRILGNSNIANKTAKRVLERYNERAGQYYDVEKERNLLRSWMRKGVEISFNAGAKYRVDLKPEPDEYLLWDEPLGGQAENIQKAARTLIEDLYASDILDDADIDRINEGGQITGGGLYNYLTNEAGIEPEQVSHDMRVFGIRGIKYLDGSSRGKGEGSYNYVIFDDADVEIQEVLRSVPQTPLDADAKSLLTEYAVGQILLGRSYKTVIETLSDISGASAEEVKAIHAAAVDVIRPTEREEMSADAKEKRRIRNEHYREADEFADPDKISQKKRESALKLTKARLENEIAKLEKEIETKQRREKSPAATTPEIEVLKAKRKALAAQKAEIFGDAAIKERERIERAKRQLEKSIARLEEKIRNRDVRYKGKPTPEVADEIQALRDQKANLDKELDAIKKAARTYDAPVKPGLSGIAQDALEKYPNDKDLILAIDRLTGSRPKSINDVVKDLREELGKTTEEAVALARRADAIVRELRAERRKEAAEAKKLTPEMVKAQNEAKVRKAQAAYRLNKFLAQLHNRPNVMERFNNDFRAKLVSNWGTQLFNAVQAVTVSTPSEVLLDLLETGIKATGLRIGETPDINAKDILLPYAYIFSNNKQLAEFALAEFPEEYFKVHSGLLGDIEIEPLKMAPEAGLTKPLHWWFDKNQVLNEKLSKISGAKMQEMHFRNAIVAATLDQIVRRKTKGAETLQSAIKSGTLPDHITEKDAKFAADKALRVTFAAHIDDALGKKLKRGYDQLDKVLPVLLNPITYARFTYTTTRVMVANPILFGALDSKKLGGPGYDTRSIAKGVLGWSGIAAAMGLMAAFGGDDDKWETLFIFGKDNPPLDIRRFFPLSAYFYMAHVIRSVAEGRPNPTLKELVEGFASLESDYFTYGAGVQFAETAYAKAMGTKDWSDVGGAGSRLLGSYLSGFLRFAKPMRDTFAQFNAEEAKIRDYGDGAGDQFIKEISKTLPAVWRLSNAEAKKDIDGNDVLTPFPMGRMIGMNLVHPTFLNPKDTVATEWANRLFPNEFTGGEFTADDRKAYQARKMLKNAARSGKQVDFEAKIKDLERTKVLTPRSANLLRSDIKLSELQSLIKARFGMNDKDIKALRQVWAKATDQERKELKDTLEHKKNRTREFNKEFGLSPVVKKYKKQNGDPDD